LIPPAEQVTFSASTKSGLREAARRNGQTRGCSERDGFESRPLQESKCDADYDCRFNPQSNPPSEIRNSTAT